MLRRVGILLFSLSLVTGACAGGESPRRLATVEPRPKPEPVATTTTTASTVTTAAPVARAVAGGSRIQRVAALPGDRPAPAPKVAAAAAPSRRGPTPTGRIEIPRIGLNHLTYEGIEMSTIDHGPSHWPGTALPGQNGNTVFPGHRVTKTRPFYDIDRIQIGDPVTFVNSSGRYTYQVTDAFVVDDEETWIADPTDTPTMTIFACHPKNSARQRYVVKGKLVRSERTPNSSEPAASSPNSGPDGNYPTAEDPSAPPETTTTTQRRGVGGLIG